MHQQWKTVVAVSLLLGCVWGVFGKEVAQAQTAPTHNMQLWDAQKTDWTDGNLKNLKNSGFSVVQNGYNASLIPSRSFLDKISSYGLSYGAYVDTRYLFRSKATSTEKSVANLYVKNPDGSTNTNEFNTFNRTYQSVVARELSKLLNGIGSSKGLYKIMFNSEHGSPISYDSLTKSIAVSGGVMTSTQGIPVYARGVLTTMPSNGTDPCRFLRWFDNWGGDIAVNTLAANSARYIYPSVKTTTDPLSDDYGHGQYRKQDILQDWVRIHSAPRDPLSIAYRTERLKSDKKLTGGEIWIGPQLGTATSTASYAAPADAFEEALWLSTAFGARGSTFWGYNAIRWSNSADLDTWSRIKKYHTSLVTNTPLLLSATDTPRVVAVLLSKSNQVLSGHAYYETDNNYENFFRALLTAHVPADVLYDEDVLNGALGKYKAVFLPGFGKISADVQAKITSFQNAGGRVIVWPKCAPLYSDAQITAGKTSSTANIQNSYPYYLLPDQYRKWRQWQASLMYAKVSDLLNVRCDNPNVIMNLVTVNGTKYIVLVNDTRTYGTWCTARGYKWMEDAGLAATCNVTIVNQSRTIQVSLPAAGMKMIQY